MPRKRILFIAEAATLAHVARPFLLARPLDPQHYEVSFASHPRYKSLLGDIPFAWHDIPSIPSEQFLAALAKGSPLYNAKTLRNYVRDDLQLIERIDPDVIVGDFRLSLSVSARIARKPYITLTNAYWSPFGRQTFPVPELPLTRMVGAKLGQKLFDLARPLAFALHSLPLNKVRKEYGLPSLGLDLLKVYTDADYTAYADVPELAPTYDLPANHCYLGPLIWSPNVALPAWWNTLPQDRPLIYATLGSSGQSDQLSRVIQALADLPVTLVAATAGRTQIQAVPQNTHVTEHIDGIHACATASLVICNGGSPTTYQALSAGKPVIGIASNLDQYLNMSMVEKTSAGKLLRAGQTSVSLIKETVQSVLNDEGMRKQAQRLQGIIAQYRPEERFEALLQNVAKGHPL